MDKLTQTNESAHRAWHGWNARRQVRIKQIINKSRPIIQVHSFRLHAAIFFLYCYQFHRGFCTFAGKVIQVSKVALPFKT